MTIKTLEYIHRLLVEEESKTREVYRAARELQGEYEERETVDEGLVKSQMEAAREYMKKHINAKTHFMSLRVRNGNTRFRAVKKNRNRRSEIDGVIKKWTKQCAEFR